VTLSCSTAFAAFWMVPRMAQFRAELPHVDLRIQTADRDLDLWARAFRWQCAAAIPDWPQYQTVPLAAEQIFPVCGAGYLAGLKRPTQPLDLLDHQLIHLEEPFRSAVTWRDWFAVAGDRSAARAEGVADQRLCFWWCSR
jgi:DNA-binding transcriptional LysR family regulator